MTPYRRRGRIWHPPWHWREDTRQQQLQDYIRALRAKESGPD